MNRRDRELEKWLKTKAEEAPTPELPFEPAVYAAEESPVSSSSPAAPAGRHMGIAVIAAAAAVMILCGAVLTFWQLSDALPVLSGDTSRTAATTSSSRRTTTTTVSTTAPILDWGPFPDVKEVSGYDAYKEGLIEKSGLAANPEGLYPEFHPEKESYILTYRAIECSISGSGKDSFVMYWVRQRSDTQYSYEVQYDDFMVYALILGGEPVAYMVNQEILQTAFGTLKLEAADFDGDGRDEIFLSSDLGGSGGVFLLSVYHYDGEGLVKYPIGEGNGGFTLKATVEPEGYYVMRSDATGYEKRFRVYNWEEEWAQKAWEEAMEYGIDIDPRVNFAVTDLNHDGVMEIGIMNVYYHYKHTDWCGEGVEVFQYDPGLGCFQAIWTDYFSQGDEDKRIWSDDFPALLEEIVRLD